MKYRITSKLNDGFAEQPPVELEVASPYDLANMLSEELANDYGVPFGVGFTLLVERVA